MGAGISPVQRAQDRAAPVAHLTLDRRPVFRSGLPALESDSLARLSSSLLFSSFSSLSLCLPPHPSPREAVLPVKFITMF